LSEYIPKPRELKQTSDTIQSIPPKEEKIIHECAETKLTKPFSIYRWIDVHICGINITSTASSNAAVTIPTLVNVSLLSISGQPYLSIE